MNTEESIELVTRARGGDQSAWNEIVEEYAPLVWSVVRGFRLGDSDAADAAQTIWLRLIEHLDSINDPACIPGWLSTTARRVCLRHLRDTAREVSVDPHDDARLDQSANTEEVESAVLRTEEAELLRAALATLDGRDRLLLGLLTSPDRISYREISARLGIPIGSIGPTRGRALDRLRAALADLEVAEMAS